jgi:hypothetical protein
MAQFERALIRECGLASRHSTVPTTSGSGDRELLWMLPGSSLLRASGASRRTISGKLGIGIGAFYKAAQSRSEKVSPASGIAAQRERYWADAQFPTW